MPRVRGRADPKGSATTAYLEWGPTTEYGNRSEDFDLVAINDAGDYLVSGETDVESGNGPLSVSSPRRIGRAPST